MRKKRPAIVQLSPDSEEVIGNQDFEGIANMDKSPFEGHKTPPLW